MLQVEKSFSYVNMQVCKMCFRRGYEGGFSVRFSDIESQLLFQCLGVAALKGRYP